MKVISLLAIFFSLCFSRKDREEKIDKHNTNFDVRRNCDAQTLLPMWSWGFARLCCDVYPQHIGKPRPTGISATFWPPAKSFFEHGDLSDSSYFKRRSIENGDAVYVATADFPVFVDVFLRLPSDFRIILVTGSEDIGAPVEIFNPNRPNFFDYKMSALWPQGQKLTMIQFLSDNRLAKWFAQNYDLVGCNANSCSPLSNDNNNNISNEYNYTAIVSKVVPIPIGLDLHSVAEKNNHDAAKIPHHVCEQRKELDSLNSVRVPFDQRPLNVIVSFDCNFDNSRIGVGRKKTRGEACDLIKSAPATLTIEDVSESHLKTKLKRHEFWSRLGNASFAIAPAGFGTDTHRLWEVLQMGAVPITLTSTLDSLYSQFPCIILKKWSDLAVPGALTTFKREIQQKFGLEPFSVEIIHKLSANYWIDLVETEQKLLK